MALRDINILETVEPPSTDHQIADRCNHCQPSQCRVPGFERIPAPEMSHRRNHTRPGRNRHSHEVFFARSSWIRILPTYSATKACTPAGAGHQKHKTSTRTKLPQP